MRIMRIRNKIVSAILCACVIAGMTLVLPLQASAANYSGSDFTSGTLAERLETIISDGISYNVSSTLPAVDGTFSSSKLYRVTLPTRAWSGYQCAAYAYAAYNYLFNCDPYRSSSVSFPDLVAKESLSYSDLANSAIRFGAYLRTTSNRDGSYHASNGHSLLILSYDTSSIITLEANKRGSSYVAEIKNRTWSDFNKILGGIGRRVSWVCQPTESVYSALGDELSVVKYTVTFDPTDGTVSPSTKTVAQGGTLDTLPIPTRPGYTFVCWSTVKEGAGSALTADNYKWLTFDNDTTLYAHWTQDKHTHTNGAYFYSDAHPHYKFYTCTTCGEVYTDGSTTNMNSCSICTPASASIPDGLYTLTPKCASNMRLDVSGASTKDEANVQVYTSNNTAAQQ